MVRTVNSKILLSNNGLYISRYHIYPENSWHAHDPQLKISYWLSTVAMENLMFSASLLSTIPNQIFSLDTDTTFWSNVFIRMTIQTIVQVFTFLSLDLFCCPWSSGFPHICHCICLVCLYTVVFIRECDSFLGGLSPGGLHGLASAWTAHSQDCSCSLQSCDYTSRWTLNLLEDFNISTWDFHFGCVESTAQLGGNWHLSRCLPVCEHIFLHLFESLLFLYKECFTVWGPQFI